MHLTEMKAIFLILIVFYSCGTVLATEKSPDLLTMLETIQNGGDVSKALYFINEMKMARKGLTAIETISPVMKSLYVKAAKRNPKLKVLLDVMNGHMPDLHDIYQLITTKSNSVLADIATAEAQNKVINEMLGLTNNLSMHMTQGGMTQLCEMFLGFKVEFKESVFRSVNRGERITLTGEDLVQFDALHLMFFFVDNYKSLIQTYNGSIAGSDNAGVVKVIQQLDFTHFKMIRALPKSLHNGKYQVGNHGNTPQDPDVARVLQDLSIASSLKSDDDSKAEAVLMDIVTRFIHVLVNIVNQSRQGQTTPPNSNVLG